MMYNVFFLVVSLVGFLSLIPIVFILGGSIIKRDKRGIIVGLVLSIIPAFCFGLYYWYNWMNERQFKEFELNERMDIINQEGDYVGMREYYAQRINLYTVYGFFVEVFYSPNENKITKVQVANRELVDLMYSEKIDIRSILE